MPAGALCLTSDIHLPLFDSLPELTYRNVRRPKVKPVKDNHAMPGPLRVLMIEDSEDDTLLIAAELRRGGFEPVFERVETAASLQAALDSHNWDLIICDYSMPEFTGPAALAAYLKKGLDIPFISVSGMVGEETVAEMMKAGAHNYVMKDNLARLVPVVRRELHAAQERRERSQTEAVSAYLASIVKSCDDAIIGKTLDGIVVSWNAGAERVYGYSAAEMIGCSISVLIPAYRPEELPEIYETIQRGEGVDGLETVRLRKDGTPVEVSLTISPIKNARGQVVGASTVARDITRRKQEENERLGLIKDLTTALTHVPLRPDSGAGVSRHSTSASQ
jgi:two-component system cell cycle sensor histidine kinase/response regulator CckA